MKLSKSSSSTLRSSALLILSLSALHVTPLAAPQVLFDDFSYADRVALKKRGWIVRTVPGWPGVPGATWREEGVTFHTGPGTRSNRILRMTSSTGGAGANTSQT